MANRYFYIKIDKGVQDSTYTVLYDSAYIAKATASRADNNQPAGDLTFENLTSDNDGRGFEVYTPDVQIDYFEVVTNDRTLKCEPARTDVGTLIYASFDSNWSSSAQCCNEGENLDPIWHDGSGSIPQSTNPVTHQKSGQVYNVPSKLYSNTEIYSPIERFEGYVSVSSTKSSTGDSYLKIDRKGTVIESGKCNFCYTYRLTNFSTVSGLTIDYEYTDCDTSTIETGSISSGSSINICSTTEPLLTSTGSLGTVENLNFFCDCNPNVLLSYSNVSSGDACTGTLTNYYINNDTFCNSTEVYSNSDCSTLGSAGYYSDGTNTRYWDGTAFTDPCYSCGIY